MQQSSSIGTANYVGYISPMFLTRKHLVTCSYGYSVSTNVSEFGIMR